MKKKLLVPLVLLFLVAMTTAALALPRCLKDPAFCRTGVITTVTCNAATGCDCDNGCRRDTTAACCPGKCCACDAAGCCHNKCCQGTATATYVGTANCCDGLWRTSTHAVENATTIWVDGHVAEYVDGACVKGVACTECPGDVGWVVLKTANYIPCGACPAESSYDIYCGEELFFVDIRDRHCGCCGSTVYGTVTKCHITDFTDAVFRTDTLPDCPNCGAVAYDYCGRMVGILVGGGKGCRPCECSCGCGQSCRYRETVFLRLRPEMFRGFEPEQPADATAAMRGATRCCQRERACNACECGRHRSREHCR